MLSARAYSFRQQSKLAISLSWIGGYVNIVLFLTCGTFVSHMTGNSTQFALGLARAEPRQIGLFGLLISCFCLGAVASAVMTESGKRRGVRSKYVLPMAVEGALLSWLAFLIDYETLVRTPEAMVFNFTAFLAAFALGLQNATITEISGAVIRTTHLTGVITDFGLEGVRFLIWYRDRVRGRIFERSGRLLLVSRRHPTAQRVLLLFCVFWSFVLGAAAGAWMHLHEPSAALFPPVAFVLWIILMDLWKPIAGVQELDLLSDPELAAHGIVKALLPADMGLFRLTAHRKGAHRPPDFAQWVELLPVRWRVIVLAMSPWTRFDANAVLALRDVVSGLHAQGRDLVIAGITAGQFRNLMQHGLLEVMDRENLCPDLEFAIARGMEVLRGNAVRTPSRSGSFEYATPGVSKAP